MAKYVLDSYALLAYFRNEQGAEKVEHLLNEAVANKHELYLTVINAGEVYYMSHRKDGAEKAETVWKALQQFPLHIFHADLEFTLAAAKIKAKYSISFADAFAAALAVMQKATLLTGNPEFKLLHKESGFKAEYLN